MGNNNDGVVVVGDVCTMWVVILMSVDKINYQQRVGE